MDSLDRSLHSRANSAITDPGPKSVLVNGTWWKPHDDLPTTAPTGAHQDEEGAVSFGALVLFTFILLLSPQKQIPALDPLRIAFLSAGLAIGSLLWERWKRRQPLLRLSWEMLVCLALPVWAFMTLPLSYWPGGSMAALTDVYLKSVAGFWLVANVVTSMRRLRLLITVLVLCTVPLAGTALKNFATGTFVYGGQTAVKRIAGYEGGLVGNPNDLALMLNLLIPVGISLFLSAKRPWMRIFILIVLGINVIAVILTFSRAGFLAMATTGIVYFVRLVRRSGPDRSWAFVMLLLTLLSLPFLPATYIDRLSTVTKIEADPTGSAQERWDHNVAAVRFVMQHPIIGAGIGMDLLALNPARWGPVHNVYFQYAVDLGFPGLVLFVILLYAVLKAARTSRRRTADVPALRSLFLLTEGVEISLIVFAVAGFFHPAAYHFYFYYFAGLALAARRATDTALSIDLSAGSSATALRHETRLMAPVVT